MVRRLMMSQITVSGVVIECVQGDIAAQRGITAVVNAANAQLRRGGGVAGAIHRAAGPGLEEESHRLAPIKPGQAVITAGYNLPNRYVIHCLGPVYGVDKPEAEILANCYRNQIDSIAFPAISTGIFGYPVEEAAEVALGTVLEETPRLESIKRIRFVLYSKDDFDVHESVCTRLAGGAEK
jgi:O-acetyl-ADP-ribose deacetylase (regulator of RNase III)